MELVTLWLSPRRLETRRLVGGRVGERRLCYPESRRGGIVDREETFQEGHPVDEVQPCSTGRPDISYDKIDRAS